MQPTHARWDVAPDDDNGENNNDEDPTNNGTARHSQPTSFPKLPAFYPRNFTIHDIHLQSAPESSVVFDEELDNELATSTNYSYQAAKSLQSIPDDILDELPEECRSALEEAKKRQEEYREYWGAESVEGLRAKFKSTTVWFP